MSEDAELHIYSSMGLYGMTDDPYEKLYARARAMPGVTYHGLKSNTEVRDALTGMDFLAYPATWQETSCLSVIEAMAAGVQVICPALGALPETTAGFAALCRFMPDKNAYADHFAGLLRAAIPGCSPLQVPYSRMMYGWDCRAIEWRKLIEGLT
jgi:glycosyltransferase involved in cell wall biosynthesis